MNIKLFKPHKKQKEFLDGVLREDVVFTTAVIGRQFGKTMTGENLAIYWAINNKSVVLWISPTDSQCQKVYKEILNSIIQSGVVKSYKQPKGDTQIILTNESKILFRSAASEDSLRGLSVDYMILDEAAFIKESTFSEILLPMMSVRGKKCLIITTPKGKNWIYNYYIKGLTEEKYNSFKFSTYDSPFVTSEMIDLFRQSLSPAQFKQEIEADFVDSASIFSNLDELMCLESLENPIAGKKYYGGIDIGLINDASVISIIDDSGNLVKYYRYVRMDSLDLIEKIVEISKKWNFQKLYIENNNQGLVIYQSLRNRIKLDEFNTNSNSKSEIINKLIHLFNTKSIKLVNDSYLKLEFQGFIFKQTNEGRTKFMADYGYNDDCVMATAIAYEAFSKNRYRAEYSKIYFGK